MKEPSIRVRTEGFRAVNKADLIIDGITLVAGENGCGKSSLSKLLYFLYKTVANFDQIVKKYLINELGDIIKLVYILASEIPSEKIFRLSGFIDELYQLNTFYSDSAKQEFSTWQSSFENIMENYVTSLKNDSSKTSLESVKKVKYIICEILKIEFADQDLEFLFLEVRKFMRTKYDNAIEQLNTRPTSIFTRKLKSSFSNRDLPNIFEVLEYGDEIVSLTKEKISIPYNIKNAIYLDTPMVLSVKESHNDYWKELNEMLFNVGDFNSEYSTFISNEITKGEVDINETSISSFDFKFKRKDGNVFNLLDVASGIKSFALLQLLLKKNLLNDKTLLIIDEPESHLHPQWIIEYARVIVMLNKELGVKFFLASHNPDFVSAIRYISEKEGRLEKVHFYLAEKSDKEYCYDYRHLETDIDPIFESFNIAIERVNQYGV